MNERESWNHIVSHPLQSWEWGEFRKTRQAIDRICGMLIVWTNIPHTPWTYGFVPMGKVPTKQDIAQLMAVGKMRRAVGIRLEPEKADEQGWKILRRLKKTRGIFKQQTLVIDLSQNEETLLKRMHPKARYNIRLAEKHGVIIEMDQSVEAFETYLDLMFGGTAKRQGVHFHDRHYHKQMWNSLSPTGMATLWVAKYLGKIIAANIIFSFNKNIYYAYGATALEHREVMAPSLLLWKITVWGKQQGMKVFDLWGSEDGKGFSRFKSQFGGELVNLPGSYDLVVNKWLYPMFRVVEEARWRLMHRSK